MKKMMIMSAALLLVVASSAIAAPAIIPTGYIQSVAGTPYTVLNDSFPADIMDYTVSPLPNVVIGLAKFPYSVVAHFYTEPQLPDVNYITFQSNSAMTMSHTCTFYFTYQSGKINITVDTSGPEAQGCQVQNNKDLILP